MQPLNDTISQKSIEEAVVRGLDNAELQAYLEDNYDYDEKSQTYTFKKDNSFGFGGGVKNPIMEQAITIIGLRGQIKDEGLPSDSSIKKAKIEPTIDEHKSANESKVQREDVLHNKRRKIQGSIMDEFTLFHLRKSSLLSLSRTKSLLYFTQRREGLLLFP